jgi:predicted RNA-binding Zn-ribbon protein involved in translation (DUF1610 family)
MPYALTLFVNCGSCGGALAVETGEHDDAPQHWSCPLCGRAHIWRAGYRVLWVTRRPGVRQPN